MERVDPVTLAVLVNNLQWIADEMNMYLVKSAFSTNIKIRRDCSCALYTKNGDMLAQGEFVPVQLGVMSQTLKEILKEYPIGTLREGEAIIHNDPFRMGSHLWEIMIFEPIFYEGDLIAFAGSLAHHVDIGGSPTMWNASTIFEEGLRIPPIRIMKEGEIQEDILKMITTNVRTPYEVRGDIAAQTAANYRGKQRIIELAKKYGINTLLKYFEAILDYSERGMRKAIESIPDGEATFEDYVEHDGIEETLIKIKVKVIVKGTDIYIDFRGSGKPGKGGVNSPWSLTHSAAYCAIKSVIAPKVPTNQGAYRAIHLLKPEEDTIVNAKFPSAVGHCTCSPAQRIVDVIIGALSKIVPEKVCACDGHWPIATFIGIDPRTGRYSSYVETYACGRGAKHNDDGADAHQTHMTNTANAPIEIIELEHPLRVDKYALIPDSGGAGKYRGGLGITRELTCLVPMTVGAMPMRPSIKPYGLFGGEGGATDLNEVIFSDGSKAVAISQNVEAGDRVVIRTSGGGGWGDPLERDIEKVEWDVLNGYISLESARKKYGCVIDPKTYKVDRERTKEFREKLKRSKTRRLKSQSS
ncbi:hydantoinase B/oxoprolinase family protein [Candidatus Aerophobetes bacterium]|uniref:Hydantoinase B/oxoprolinase family protein n=1 Tax=Aerophobetes bacterium TaxID=2030807 RepID=A0A662DMS8_UNCAE|nr:MAG: hydantoinase B/oxoprolinase family protein [Candidatus Aerophobetes bacterium]